MATDRHHEQLAIMRHSAAHLLAHAITELYSDTLLTIGPATEDGFFYDVLPSQNFKEEDIPLLEERMHEIATRNIPITHAQMPKEEARKLYAHNKFKLELIDNIEGDTVGIATQGNFFDLCRGGHVSSTGDIKYFKLLHLSGSYWRADRNNQPLQRITGVAFCTQQELATFEQQREDALKYDHRRLGKQLNLFSFHDEGVGFPFYHPYGKRILNTLMAHMRRLYAKYNYQEIATPTMLSDQLWRQSGHYQHYKENMFFCTIDDAHYAVKPMNCPGSILIYKERPRSYRELPMRLAEFGHVHRFELSGVLHGLFRVRAFTQDDGHIYCTIDQLKQEVMTAIAMSNEVWQRFNFSTVNITLSTRPANAMGSDELWEKATNALKDALDAHNIAYSIAHGDGAFYGPKIDFNIYDSIGRSWQCGTIQVDFFQPENFDLTYINSEGKKTRPVIVHRAIYGSLERFLGILLEHYKGRLPFWLAPVQIKILTITDEQQAYAYNLMQQLQHSGLRVEIDTTSDPISGKIKHAQLMYIPWLLVIGNKEVTNNSVTLRYLDGKQEFGIPVADFITKALTANAS